MLQDTISRLIANTNDSRFISWWTKLITAKPQIKRPIIWSSNPPMNGQDYLSGQSHVAIPFLYHNHIHNTTQHNTHTNKTCPVCCVLHNIQIFPHHQTMNEPQVLQVWSKRGPEPRLRKKEKYLYFTLLY